MTISDWAAIATAAGTFAAAATAVWVALWTDRRAARRIRQEHERSDRLLAEERAHGMAQLEDERRIAREREQFAEAYKVQVALGEKAQIVSDVPIERLSTAENIYGEWTDAMRLAVLVVNHGSFTITGIEARLSYDGMSLVPLDRYQRLSGFGNVRPKVREGWDPSSERAMYGVLAPWDAGIRFESSDVAAKSLKSPYPLVRWTDRWGTRWEHKRGEVRPVRDDEPWSPLRRRPGAPRTRGRPAGEACCSKSLAESAGRLPVRGILVC